MIGICGPLLLFKDVSGMSSWNTSDEYCVPNFFLLLRGVGENLGSWFLFGLPPTVPGDLHDEVGSGGREVVTEVLEGLGVRRRGRLVGNSATLVWALMSFVTI